MVAALLVLPAAASADHLGNRISGTVTGPTLEGIAPLADICVKVYSEDDQSLVDEVTTNASGAYHSDSLLAGDYRVEFSDCGDHHNVVTEWYLNKPSFGAADTVTVVNLEPTAGIDAVLAEGGTITGLVTDSSEAALDDICVDAYDTSFGHAGSASTDEAGGYTIDDLPSDDFRVEFSDCNSIHNTLDEWFDDERSFTDATDVAVVAGSETSDISAVLERAGSISGTVTDSSPAGLGGICVGAYDGTQSLVRSTTTGKTGAYEIFGLPSGDFRVQFSDCGDNHDVLDEWFDDAASFAAADDVAVVAGVETAGIDAELAAGGSISGKVTDSSAAELDGICVDAYDSSFVLARATTTDANGDYTLVGLPSGDFRVEFTDCGDNHGVFDEWYDDAASFDDATDVAVTAGATTGGIDAELSTGGSISGTVTDSTPTGLGGICVDAYDAGQGLLSSVSTSGSGAYTIPGLPSGDIRVRFSDCGNSHNVLDEWYDDAASFGAATDVAVTEGVDTPGIDAELADGGSISGTVTDSSATPLPGICVAVYDATPSLVRSGTTGLGGTYTVGGLPTGDFTVEFSECNSFTPSFLSEWFDDMPSIETADAVAVTAGANTPGIDAALEEPGSISGKVTDSAVAELSDICVAAYDGPDSIAGSDITDATGDYSIGGLRPGSFRVEFSDCGDNHNVFGEWYDDAADFDSATDVAVASGADTPGIDAELAKGGSISGKVTDEFSGGEISDVCVELYDLGQVLLGTEVTDSRGNYKFRRLAAASFRVQFVDCNDTNTVDEWYEDKTSFSTADNVVVAAGAETAGINGELARGGSISGTVTEEVSGDLLAGVCVEAYDQSESTVASVKTDGRGKYSIRRLLDGNYRLQFADCPENVHLEQEWYDDKSSFGAADDVTVALGADSSGIDAALALDTTPPDTIVDSGPADGSTIATTSATFSFRGVPAADTAKIQCKIDGAPYADCTSPKAFSGLSDGPHTARFRAEDAAGNRDATPAVRNFTVTAAACERARARVDFAKISLRKAKKAVKNARKAVKKAKRAGDDRALAKAKRKLKKRRAWEKRAKRKLKRLKAERDAVCV